MSGALEELLLEARRVGKIPWTCDGYMQSQVLGLLWFEGIQDEETMEETLVRREREADCSGVICNWEPL